MVYLQEKTLAAKRSGVTHIVLPEANQRDFEELADYVRDGIQVHYASNYQVHCSLLSPEMTVLLGCV